MEKERKRERERKNLEEEKEERKRPTGLCRWPLDEKFQYSTHFESVVRAGRYSRNLARPASTLHTQRTKCSVSLIFFGRR